MRQSHALAAARCLAIALCLLGPLSPGRAAGPGAAPPGPSMGLHGMILFGGADGLFLSHMPMVHRPHDTQVVLQVHVADPRRDAALRRELAARPGLWTIVPERFEIDRLAPGAPDALHAFRADVVRGHFERGGVVAASGDEFVIDRVVFDHRLDAQPPAGTTLQYRIVDAGAGAREHFLVRWIAARPGADHILRFAYRSDARLPASIEARADAGLVASPDSLQQALRRAGVSSARPAQAIYLETGDLE